MEVTLHDDVFSSLNFGFTTWAASGKVREESLSIFSNGGVRGHLGSCLVSSEGLFY